VLAHAPALHSSIELAGDDLIPMILGLRTYAVQPAARRPLIDFMVRVVRAAGCRVLFASNADRAPFVITFETREGERLGIVPYAFLATRTPTKNRPHDERSFSTVKPKAVPEPMHPTAARSSPAWCRSS
jgi:hypothetical protein